MGILDSLVVKMLPVVPKAIVAQVSKPYIAGETLESAVACVKDLNRKGFLATVDVLGEFVTNLAQAKESLDAYKQLLAAIETHGLDANISVKPTSFGLLLDEKKCWDLLGNLLDDTAARGNFMRLDMEDSPCTSKTIEMYQAFRQKHPGKVGVVLQAYLRRTVEDIEKITAEAPSHFRICKGIYVEPEEIAYKGYEEVRANYLKCLRTMLEAGAYVGIATHDDYLVKEAEKMVAQMGLKSHQYEFQMLLGVRERMRDEIRARGHRLRIYVPFGADWYGYSIRRLKENPAMAGMVFKAMFFKG